MEAVSQVQGGVQLSVEVVSQVQGGYNSHCLEVASQKYRVGTTVSGIGVTSTGGVQLSVEVVVSQVQGRGTTVSGNGVTSTGWGTAVSQRGGKCFGLG